MDAFESLICTLLEMDGYWIKPNYKIELTSEDKRAIKRPSCPRWEVDILAYRSSTNEVDVVECKSYIDSNGVQFSDLQEDGRYADRYKLFTDPNLKRVVFARLAEELVEKGLCRKQPKIRLCLAAGKIKKATDRERLHQQFSESSWKLLDDDWIRKTLEKLSKSKYQNDIASVVAKLLLRK